MYFYHSGVEEEFRIKNIDLFETDKKKTGFYMYGPGDVDKAYSDTERKNMKNNTNKYRVLCLELSDDLQMYKKDSFGAIDHVSRNEIMRLISQGYDIIAGRNENGMQYILLNMNKIRSYYVDDNYTKQK